MAKKTKTPLVLTVIKLSFSVLQVLTPAWAKKWAINLFFTPVKYSYPARELDILKKAHGFDFLSGGKKLQAYSWGNGPIILFMHGWSGRATQVVELIQPLTAQGFKVVAFDAPGHGSSEGKKSDILQFADAILDLEKIVGTMYAGVGHSLGGVSLLLARKSGLKLTKLITISSPAVADGIIKEFQKKIGAKDKVGNAIKAHVKKKYNKAFEEFSASVIVEDNFPSTNLLIMHDLDDVEVLVSDAQELNRRVPDSQLHLTKGLGHTRILRDSGVVLKVVDFVVKEKNVYA